MIGQFDPVYSTNNIWWDEEFGECLTLHLENMKEDIANTDSAITNLQTLIGNTSIESQIHVAVSDKADINHEHSNYATTTHTHSEYAVVDHEHNDYALSTHTHTGFANNTHNHPEYALIDNVSDLEDKVGNTSVSEQISTAMLTKADTDHTHAEYANANHEHSEYALSEHIHSNYALTSYVNEIQEQIGNASVAEQISSAVSTKANVNHVHEEYSIVEHNHDEDYALINHIHNNYVTVPSFDELSATVSNKANVSHNHNDVYYTETEINSKLEVKSDITHNHDGVYDISGAATNALISANAYTDSKIDALVGEGASTTLDTIGEISSAIEDNQDAIDILNSAIANKANATDLTSHTNNTTVHITSTERSNWNVAKTHADTVHAPSNAEPNQNAFSNVKVGTTTISADSKTDTLTFVAGSNVALTPNEDGDSITINAIDTVYTLPSAGSSLGGVKTGGDVTISNGVITVNDDSHNHVISNIDNLQSTLDAKANANDLTTHTSNKSNPHGVTLAQLGVTATASELNYVDGVTSNIQTQLNEKSNTNHTHNYAGSSSAGGSATSANKLATARTLTIGNTGKTFDGSANVSWNLSEIGAVNKTGDTMTGSLALITNTGNAPLIIKRLSEDKESTKIYQNDNGLVFDVLNDETSAGLYFNFSATDTEGGNEGVGANSNTASLVSNTSGTVMTATTFKGALNGNASSATKLTTSAGSTTQPVYFSDGKPVACTYTLGKSVPSDAVFTDTNTHYTSKNVVGGTSATSNTTSALTNGNVYLNSVENGAVTSSHKISGSGATTVTTDASGNIIISSTDTNTNTTYSAGTGISLSGTTFSNSGVRSISTGSSNGTISVNTNGTSANVAVKGLGSAAYTASSAYLGSSGDQTLTNGSFIIPDASTSCSYRATRTIDSVVSQADLYISENGNPRLRFNSGGSTVNYLSLQGDSTVLGKPLAIGSGGTGATTVASARDNLGIACTSLYSGSLSSGSCTFTYGSHKAYLIVGKPSSSSYGIVSLYVPASYITSSKTMQLADNLYYMLFDISGSGTTGKITVGTNNNSGTIMKVYGIN